MRFKLNCGLASAAGLALCLAASMAWADTLELKNGSVIHGKFLGGTESEISFQVASSVQKYNIADVASVKFDSETTASDKPASPESSLPEAPEAAKPDASKTSGEVTIPAGTTISVRTIDEIDSAQSQGGASFQASLAEPVVVEGNVVVAKDADVYGRLVEAKQPGTFTGRSQLRLELTAIVVNGKTVRLVTGEYQVTGKSRGASTAKRTIAGAAVGSVIGAAADGGKGAAIGAGVGAAAGAGSEIVTNGDQVRVPSESVIDFTLEQDVSVPTRPM